MATPVSGRKTSRYMRENRRELQVLPRTRINKIVSGRIAQRDNARGYVRLCVKRLFFLSFPPLRFATPARTADVLIALTTFQAGALFGRPRIYR